MIEFKFSGFEPSSRLRGVTKKILWGIQDRSPSYSRLQAHMKKEGSHFEGSIRVCYGEGCFEVKSSHESPDQLAQVLSSEIYSKISEWKKTRKVA